MIGIFGQSDAGKIRPANEDAFGFHVFSGDLAYAVVCDGMGGENGGELASRTARDAIEKALKKNLAVEPAPASIKGMVESAVQAANVQVNLLAEENPLLKGMGTTVVVAVYYKNTVYLANVGDSRAYRVGPNGLEKLTVDHTVVQMLLSSGQISEEEAKNHPKRHYITRAVGVGDELDIEYTEYPFNREEQLLICTDGLYNSLNDEQLTALTLECARKKDVSNLIEAANQQGGSDNITAVVLTQM